MATTFTHSSASAGSALPDLTSSITIVSTIGVVRGHRTSAYKADCRGTCVAVKASQLVDLSGSSGSYRRSPHQYIQEELAHWRTLNSPHILPLLGTCTLVPGGLALVSPWSDNGDAKVYLRDNPNVSPDAMVLDVARGVRYLHNEEPPVVHGDLRAANILIDSFGNACISDFGFSRFLDEEDVYQSSAARGDAAWLAPERLFPENFGFTAKSSSTPASDIYSLGMLIYELYSGQVPFYDLRPSYQLPVRVMNGVRPPRPTPTVNRTMSDSRWATVSQCWKTNATTRPTSATVVNWLKQG